MVVVVELSNKVFYAHKTGNLLPGAEMLTSNPVSVLLPPQPLRSPLPLPLPLPVFHDVQKQSLGQQDLR